MVLLVRFGEIALKSRFVRRQLRDRLVSNVQELFAAERVECVTESDEARIYVHTDDERRARTILARAFGIVSFSPAAEGPANLAALRELALAEASRLLTPGTSFAIRPRQVGAAFTSQDLAKDVGAAVLAAHPGVRVDLDDPDVEIYIEARRNRGFVFVESWPGPGGLPLGSQGKAIALVDSEGGMVAAWLAMKRGCRVVIASTEDNGFVEPLRRWDVRLQWAYVPSVEGLREQVDRTQAEAVFVGTRWTEFSPSRRPQLGVPIFEPLVGMTDEDVTRLVTRIRTS